MPIVLKAMMLGAFMQPDLPPAVAEMIARWKSDRNGEQDCCCAHKRKASSPISKDPARGHRQGPLYAYGYIHNARAPRGWGAPGTYVLGPGALLNLYKTARSEWPVDKWDNSALC